jgi:iron(III) transport system substrate-binding protein
MRTLAGIPTRRSSTKLAPLHRRRLIVIAAVASLAAACAGATAAAPDVSARPAAGPGPTPASPREWNAIVAEAKRQGNVVLYTGFLPDRLADFKAAFEKKYGITLTINRAVDSVLVTQVTAEHSSRRAIADLWVTTSLPYVLGSLKNGWVVDARGPDFFKRGYDRLKYAKPGKAWQPGASAIGFGWNTQLYPPGLNRLQDLLNPALSGRIGVLQPTSPAGFDYYIWLRATYGMNFIRSLAAQKPKLYVSAAPMQAALGSGEISASAFLSPSVLELKGQGAPVDWKPLGWNTAWYGMIFKQAPHRAAAQVLANFIVTPEGQRTLFLRNIPALPNIPGTFSVPFRRVKLSELTPAKIAEQRAEWNALFSR